MPTHEETEHILVSENDATSEVLAAHVPRVTWINGLPWKIAQRVITPLAMPHQHIAVDRGELRKMMKQEGALLALWTSNWDEFRESEWWWTCCDASNYDVSSLESRRGRRDIRKGLRGCRVENIDNQKFAHLAYPIYAEAKKNDGYVAVVPAEREYAEEVHRMAQYPGREFWGAFHGDKLAAYAACEIIDGAVAIGSTRSDPDLRRYSPNGALFYSITRHYLQHGMLYVSNGSRTLWHPSTINDVLQRLGFRRVYCRVNIEASPVLKTVDLVRLTRWGRHLGLPKLLGKKWLQLEGFHRLARISETYY